MNLSLMSRRGFFAAVFVAMMGVQMPASADQTPQETIEKSITALLDEFVSQKASLQADKKKLYALVDEGASPLFDFDYISKLVLAKNWKSASEDQRTRFAFEFKRLLVVTYATALFQYTGDEKMTFEGTEIKERKGKRFAKVNSQVALQKGSPIPVKYDMIQDPEKNNDWRIYNLSVGSLNMALNYRKVIQSSIASEGLEGVIASMKANNDKNY